ncbi:MAG: hypothetical protein V3V14_11330 [Saprospiraceae bacterium]
MEQSNTKIPVTFWIISGIALFWNSMGVFAFISDMTMGETDFAQMSEGMKALYANNPLWMKAIYGIATIGGLIASIGLLLRKKWAAPAFLISLIAAAIQMARSVFATNAVEVMGNSAIALPTMIIIIGAFLWYYAKKGIIKGWLK